MHKNECKVVLVFRYLGVEMSPLSVSKCHELGSFLRFHSEQLLLKIWLFFMNRK